MKLSPSTFAYLLYCAAITLGAPTSKRQSGTSYNGGTTANDVENGVCAPLTLIFARGSTETGNMGSTVGPALAKALISSLGADGVAIQGVDYSATIASNASGGSDGGPELAKLAKQALQNCPNTKIAIAGYSQGATVCHYAVAQGGLSASDVSSATLYGDPLNGSAVGDLPSSQTKEFCASGDGVCEGGGFAITAAHLSYTQGQDIDEGAQFIVQNAGTSTSSSPSGGSSAAPAGGASAAPSEASGGLGGFGGGFPTSAGGFGGGFPTSAGGFGGLGSLPTSGFGGLGGLGGLTPSGTAAGLGGFGGFPTALPSGSAGGLGGLGGFPTESSPSEGSDGLGGFDLGEDCADS